MLSPRFFCMLFTLFCGAPLFSQIKTTHEKETIPLQYDTIKKQCMRYDRPDGMLINHLVMSAQHAHNSADMQSISDQLNNIRVTTFAKTQSHIFDAIVIEALFSILLIQKPFVKSLETINSLLVLLPDTYATVNNLIQEHPEYSLLVPAERLILYVIHAHDMYLFFFSGTIPDQFTKCLYGIVAAIALFVSKNNMYPCTGVASILKMVKKKMPAPQQATLLFLSQFLFDTLYQGTSLALFYHASFYTVSSIDMAAIFGAKTLFFALWEEWPVTLSTLFYALQSGNQVIIDLSIKALSVESVNEAMFIHMVKWHHTEQAQALWDRYHPLWEYPYHSVIATATNNIPWILYCLNQEEQALYTDNKNHERCALGVANKGLIYTLSTLNDKYHYINQDFLLAPPQVTKPFPLLVRINEDVANLLNPQSYNCSEFKNEDYNTALHLAVQFQDTQKIKVILANKKYHDIINVQNKHGETALHYAIAEQNYALTKQLLEHNANPLIKEKCGCTALHLAVATNNNELIKLVLQYQPYTSEKCMPFSINDIRSRTLFIIFYDEFIKNLPGGKTLTLDMKNFHHQESLRNLQSESSLYSLIFKENTEGVKLLLAHGASYNEPRYNRPYALYNTPLDCALRCRLFNSAAALMELRPTFTERCSSDNDNLGDTFLCRAISMDAPRNIIEEIVKKNGNLDTCDAHGYPPLCLVAHKIITEDFSLDIFTLLLKYGANPHGKTAGGESIIAYIKHNFFKHGIPVKAIVSTLLQQLKDFGAHA